MFVLKKRKYTWFDTFYIPFSCAPLWTMGITMQKILTCLAAVFQVVVVAEFIDSVGIAVTNRVFDKEVLQWFLLLVLIVSWKRVGWRVGNLCSNQIATKGNEQFMNEYTQKCARLQYYLLEDADTENLMNRVTVNNKMNWHFKRMIQNFLNFFVIMIPKVAGILIIIAMQVWWLAIAVAVMTVPLVIISLRGGKQIYKAKEEASICERRHRYFFDVLTGREAVEERSLFGYTESLNKEWLKQFDTARRINLKAETVFAMNVNRGSILTSILSSAIILIMIPLVASGQMSLGIFISLSAAVYDLVDQLGWGMTRQVADIAKFNEYMKELGKFAALPERQSSEERMKGKDNETAEVCVAKRIAEREGDTTKDCAIQEFEELEFRNVTFHYPGSTINILENFSMKLVKGRHYAIVGENGAGKSTFIKLLTGLYPDYEGEILFNGREMRSFDSEEWKKLFSGVYQDFARYYISVEENIQIGDFENMNVPEAKARMHQVCEKLEIHEAITSLRHRYATKLGKLDEDGVDLSGGQWQKVAMARALMNDAPLLILDEPTAALDPISESLVYEQFGEISKDRTTIFISHRLGSTKLADYIFVIGDGHVKEQGSHADLLDKNGLYAEMFKTQQSWYIVEEGEE